MPNSNTYAILYDRTIHMVMISETDTQIIQEMELFTGVLLLPADRFP